MASSQNVIALIVAAGRGTRFASDAPKQYQGLGGAPILRHSVLRLLDHPEVDGVRVVIRHDDRKRHDRALAGIELIPPVIGGESRQDSVRLGLESLAAEPPESVLIHDAARPLVDASTISATLGALVTSAGAVPALPVTDSLKRATEGHIIGSLERAGLYRAQTPQAFRYPEILAAHRACAGNALSDDALVAEKAGLEVAIVAGSEENLKITTAEDLARAEALLASRLGDVRVGNGFDVHRFGPGDEIMLCGVAIPHDAGLIGHSDADVGLHALTDAILGAIGAGDIGQHFPPSDPRWKGAPSERFLRDARQRVAAAGGMITHVDLTLILERPRIAPHRDAMVARVAGLLDLANGRVSIKATTTEGLGFLGRGEGIAAQATATIRLPA